VRDLATKIAVPDPARAPLVLQLFERYATGQESDRTLAAWLNATGARTTRGRQFGKDTVREMLCNAAYAAYAGYVSGLRDKSRAIKGLHEAIVTDELFDRVQEVRGWRIRVVKPGPPSDEYLLRKLLRCERCGARMHGTRGSKTTVRRYMCSTRRYGHSCGERIVKAEALEGQLVDWIRAFHPDRQLHDLLLQTTEAAIAERHEQPREGIPTARPARNPQLIVSERCSTSSPASGTLRPSPPSDASYCSPYSSKSGRRTGRSSPCNHTTTSCPTSKPHSSSLNTNGTGWCQKRERRGSNPCSAPHRDPHSERGGLIASRSGASAIKCSACVTLR
jgi:hypothetical protein